MTDRQRQAQLWVGCLVLPVLLLWSGMLQLELPQSVFLPLHTTLEFGAIVVAMLGFGIAWHAHSNNRPGTILLLGLVLGGSGLLDLGHALSYPGMPSLVTPSSPQKAIVFWLAARTLVATGLLVVAIRPWGAFRSSGTRSMMRLGVLLYVLAVYTVTLAYPHALPDFFVVGQGLTPLKIQLELMLVGLFLAGAWLHHRRAHASELSADLFAAAGVAALAEIFFTQYGRVTDLINLSGHVYKIISCGFVYRAVFVDSVRSPFKALEMALQREKSLNDEQHAFVRTLDLLEEAVLELDLRGRVVRANNGWWKLIGVPATKQSSILNVLHEEDHEAFNLHLHELTSGNKTEFHGRFRLQLGNRPLQWIECRFVSDLDTHGYVIGLRGVLRDITKNYLQERHISHMALHDALTGLPNRVLLEDRLKQAVQHAARDKQHVGVCFIDLDHFKNINDAYGHKTGDAFLVALTQVLKRCLRDGDTLARWGGDEFVVLLPGLHSLEDARLVARKMIDSMRATIMLEELALNATFSVGIAIYPEDDPTGDVDLLLAQADRAMFYAKAQGRNNFQLFADMSSKGLGKKELYIQSRLAQAIRDGFIQAWYQPLVSAQPDAEGLHRLVGIEVLARWHDPELGWISPGSFIPMAENLGLISELGQSVRQKAFAHFRDWLQTRPELSLSINISKRQLFGTDFVDLLMADLALYGLSPKNIVLEVTESVALMEVEFAEERLRQLASIGFTLSLDDFGTGYASLSQLHELPIDEVKIDIAFVRRVHTPEGLRLVQGIVSLTKALHLRSVAEGVEDAATAHTLASLGVDVLQGYHFGRPCDAATFTQLPDLQPHTPHTTT